MPSHSKQRQETAYGTINSGTQLDVRQRTSWDSPPATMQTGMPNLTPTAASRDDFATNITAAGGDGIRAFNYGNGDVTVNDKFRHRQLPRDHAVSGAQDGNC